MKHVTKYYARLLSFCMILTGASAVTHASEKDYGADYYEDEGKLLFKVRGFGIKSEAKQKGLPSPLAGSARSSNPFIVNGFGGDTATTIFFNDRVAAELSLGVHVLNTKYSTINNISYNYNGSEVLSKRKKIFSIPLTLTGQYHIAPFGAVRPYVGAGYHGAYIFTKSKEFKINNSHGAVLQLGVDFVAKDDTLINFDIRQYLMKAKVKYKGALVGNSNNVSSTAKINPLIVSLGVGFKF